MKKRDLLSVLIEGMKLVISMYEICRTEKNVGSLATYKNLVETTNFLLEMQKFLRENKTHYLHNSSEEFYLF